MTNLVADFSAILRVTLLFSRSRFPQCHPQINSVLQTALDRTPTPPSAPPTLLTFRSPPCPLRSPSPSRTPSPPTRRAPAPCSFRPICNRRVPVHTHRSTVSATATACPRLTRSTQKTSTRRTSSSSELQSAALSNHNAFCPQINHEFYSKEPLTCSHFNGVHICGLLEYNLCVCARLQQWPSHSTRVALAVGF